MPSVEVLPVPRRDFMCDTAMRRMVSLSGLRARALQVGTMSDSSVMYAVILFRRRRSISLWFSLKKKGGEEEDEVTGEPGASAARQRPHKARVQHTEMRQAR